MSEHRNTSGVNAAASAEALLDRPLTARSVIASLLLGRRPPRAPVALLVRWCGLFGISGTAARVALTRMVERGELAAADATYELAGRVLARQGEQEFALAPTLAPWDGRWRLAIVSNGQRPAGERAALRAAAAQLHLAELREGVWTRPANLPADAVSAGAQRTVDAQCEWWTAAAPQRDEVALAERLFAVRARAERGRRLLDRLVAVTAALDDERLAEGFVTGAAVAQHLRRDPLLPVELLPASWPGDDLRAAYAAYLPAFGTALTDWYERHE